MINIVATLINNNKMRNFILILSIILISGFTLAQKLPDAFTNIDPVLEPAAIVGVTNNYNYGLKY